LPLPLGDQLTDRWDNVTLPQATRDGARLAADLDEFGYCVIADALDSDTLDNVRQRIHEQATAEFALTDDVKNPANTNSTTQWINMLLNKGDEFLHLMGHPLIDPLIERLLGPDFLLSTFDAHVVRPGGNVMPLHTDQWWMPPPVAPGAASTAPSAMVRDAGTALDPDHRLAAISPAVVCNIMWMVSDFSAEIGATRVVPRSHLTGAAPDASVPHLVPSIAAEGPAGTAVVLDGRVWHGAGVNVGTTARYGVTTNYCAPQCRPLENYVRGLRPEIMERLPPEIIARLGFATWSSYGHTGDPDTACALPGDVVMGALRPSDN
jgi:ectoine hydroxylase-related dioxygenase (phytanoyl-CoA dioxygenase family)